MKLSQFLIVIPEANGNFIVASTLTKAVARFNKNAWDDLKSGSPSRCQNLTREQWRQCENMKFIVPNDLDENKYLKKVFDQDRLNPSSLSAYVTFTTDCNFNCAYCYEKGQVIKKTMSQNVLSQTVRWFQNRLATKKYKNCSIYLYGGEPLLQKNKVGGFLESMRKVGARNDVDLWTCLVTNGYYASPRAMAQLIKLGLKCIHFTLDGPEHIHNARRPLINGKGTFVKILSNMISAINHTPSVEIECRINFDKENIASIPCLLDTLALKDSDRKLSIYFNAIYQTMTQSKSGCSFCSLNTIKSSESIADNLGYLYEQAVRRGYSIDQDFFKKGPCLVVARDACLIDPEGDLYKCVDMIGCKDYRVGSVFDENYNTLYDKFMSAPACGECLTTNCAYIPICAGGCAMESIINNGDMFKKSCPVALIDAVNRRLLPLRFQ